jgi:hypothetical protein
MDTENVFSFATTVNVIPARGGENFASLNKGTTPVKTGIPQRPMTSVKATPVKKPTANVPKSAGKYVDRKPFSPLTSSASVGESSKEAARMAKNQSTMERIQRVAQLKEKWAKEREQKAQFYHDKRTVQLQKLQEDSQQAAEMRRKNIEKQREFDYREKQAKRDQLASSLEARSQLAKDLEAENKARRRISIFLNSQMRKKSKEREQELNSQKKSEEESLHASRQLDALQLREAKKEEEERKRESMCNRTLLAQEQKRIAEELAQQKKEEELSILKLRKQNWEDDINSKKSEEERRRESVAFRLDEWRKHKGVEDELSRSMEHGELDLIHTRHADWKDVQAYKEEEERNRRESLAFRLDKWREEKSLEQKNKEQQEIAREIDNELSCQARDDVQEYRNQVKESRRQSLAYRLDKARKDRDFEEGQKALRQLVLKEEKRLNDLDREDVQNYRQMIADARRQSLEYRNQTEYQERMRLEGERQAQQLADVADRELRDAAWRDVQAYREQQRAEQRKSMAFRIADAQRKHEIELCQHQEALQRMHLDFQCKREDWLALQESKREEAERRRKSVSLRLDSWRQQRLAEEKERERKEMIAEEEAILREMDREELFAAKLAQDMIDRKTMIGTQMIH